MKRNILSFILLLLAISAQAQKQRFFNLTVEDVTIDSLLPHFTYAIPIGENYADSTYQLEIRYPEFHAIINCRECHFLACQIYNNKW